MYEIKETNRFKKRFRRLDKKTQKRILDEIIKLSDNPDDPILGAGAVTNFPGLLKIRVGGYRLIYSVDRKKKFIWLETVGPRGQVYRELPRVNAGDVNVINRLLDDIKKGHFLI